jgi:hypothetical protein
MFLSNKLIISFNIFKQVKRTAHFDTTENQLVHLKTVNVLKHQSVCAPHVLSGEVEPLDFD